MAISKYTNFLKTVSSLKQGQAGSSSSKAKDKPVKDKPVKDKPVKDKPVKDIVPKVTSKAKKAKETPKKTQDASVKAAKAKERPKKTEVDSSKEMAGTTLPGSRSTRQGNVQEMSAKVPKAKNLSSKNVEVPVSEVDEPTPSRSTRKRKGPELSAVVKKGKKNGPSLPVDAPTSTRSTRSSPMITAGKISANKLSDKKNSKSSSGKKAKDTSKASQSKDTSAPKKLDLNASTGESAKKSVPAKVATANTRGKLKAEPEEKKRPRRR